MDASSIISRFGLLMPAVDALVAGISEDDARWRPPSGAWSIVEIVAHLADEEVADFSVRLRATLEDPSQPWPPIDPEGWARNRDYRSRSLAAEVERLRAARAGNQGWLATVQGADWSVAHTHPRLGVMRAGDMLAAWAAHDLLHIRQLTKRRFELVSRDSEPFSTAYAGAWDT